MKFSEFSPNEIDKLENVWKELEKGSEMTWFQTYDWYKIVNKHFLMEKKKAPFRFGTYVLISDDNDNPLLIAPIQVVKIGFYVKRIGLRKGFYFIGRQGYSDYLNFIYKDYKDEYLDKLFEYLKNKYKLNFFNFENVSEETNVYKYLSNIENVEKIDSFCMKIDLPDDFEEYRLSLAKSVRRNMTTAFNRAKKDNLDFSYEIITHLDDKLREELRNVYAPRYSKKNSRDYDGMSKQAKIYTKCRNAIVNSTSKPIDVLSELDPCWCLLCKCNGEVASFFYDVYLPEKKTVYQLIAGVNEKYKWYGPGKTQLYSFIMDEITNGKPQIQTIDLTRGNEPYKYDFKGSELITSQFDFYL